MSEGIEALQLKEDDVTKFLAAGAHLGAQNVDRHMESYVYKRKGDGIHIINLRKTWEKLVLAARVIAGIENPADVCVLSSRPYGTVSQSRWFSFFSKVMLIAYNVNNKLTINIHVFYKEPLLCFLSLKFPVFFTVSASQFLTSSLFFNLSSRLLVT